MDPQTEPVRYVCGDCGKETTLKPGDRVQCGDCGYGVRRTRREFLSMKHGESLDLRHASGCIHANDSCSCLVS